MTRTKRWIGTGLVVLLAGALPVEAQAGRSGDAPGEIEQIERLGDQGDDEARRVWRYGSGDVAREAAYEEMSLDYGQRLAVGRPWRVHVVLRNPRGRPGEVALAADADGRRGAVLGPPAGSGEGSFTIEASRRGARVRLERGALFLTNWSGRESACMVAAGACAQALGTAYALRVDDTGRAYLSVTQDSVEIQWWDGPDEGPLEGACDDVAPGRPCHQIARPGEVWTWTETDPPRDWEEDNRALLGFATLSAMYAALDDAVEQNARDIWDDSIFKKPLFWVAGGAILGGVACIIWCGGDDVTGTVIINP